MAYTKAVGESWFATAVDPTADPDNPPPPFVKEYENELDKKVYKLLSRKVKASHAMAIVGDCDRIGDRKGSASWVRLKHEYDPVGLTYTVNKVFELLEVSQEACTASKHMVHMDTAITEALRPFLKQGGGYDWQLFG